MAHNCGCSLPFGLHGWLCQVGHWGSFSTLWPSTSWQTSPIAPQEGQWVRPSSVKYYFSLPWSFGGVILLLSCTKGMMLPCAIETRTGWWQWKHFRSSNDIIGISWPKTVSFVVCLFFFWRCAAECVVWYLSFSHSMGWFIVLRVLACRPQATELTQRDTKEVSELPPQVSACSLVTAPWISLKVMFSPEFHGRLSWPPWRSGFPDEQFYSGSCLGDETLLCMWVRQYDHLSMKN